MLLFKYILKKKKSYQFVIFDDNLKFPLVLNNQQNHNEKSLVTIRDRFMITVLLK